MSLKNCSYRKRNRQAGFSLMEVLVALLVLAIGLIGLAGLQSSSIRFNHNSYLRSQALVLVNDITDRMRANKEAVNLGILNANQGYNNVAGAVVTGCTTTAGCSPTQMAATDVALWNQLIAATLPADSNGAARGTVELCDGTKPAGNVCQAPSHLITINWGEQGVAGLEDKIFTTSVQP